MKFCAFSSGSNGNCYYVEMGSHRMLVDLGLSKKRIEENLLAIGIQPESITEVFLTHEHADHVSGVGVWMRAHRAPVYATDGTWKGVLEVQKNIPEAQSLRLWCDEPFYLEDETVRVEPIPLCHDANDPCGYAFWGEEKSIVIITDTGCLTERMAVLAQEADVLVLESNHDLWMLRHGPYPKNLIDRIEGCTGHLSNDTCSQLLASMGAKEKKARAQYVYLGHLSHENNTPTKALDCLLETFKAQGIDAKQETKSKTAGGEQEQIVTSDGWMRIALCPRTEATEVLEL